MTVQAQADNPAVSVVVPVFDEEQVVEATFRRLSAVMDDTGLRWELLFVDDGSRDGTARILDRIADYDPRVRVIHLSRNFGHQVAISGGLDHAAGAAVIVIDGDLQDPPELIPAMVAKWREGFDVVYARRARRQGETAWKRLSASLFYRLLRSVTDVDIPVDTGDFRLVDRRVLAVLRAMPERHRFVRGMVSWVGLKQAAIPYVREPRAAGATRYPLRKMLRLAADAITSFSGWPARLPSYLGLACLAGAVAALARQGGLLATVLAGDGLVLLALGILGEYAARIYDEVRGRPLYVIQSTRNMGEGRRVRHTAVRPVVRRGVRG